MPQHCGLGLPPCATQIELTLPLFVKCALFEAMRYPHRFIDSQILSLALIIILDYGYTVLWTWYLTGLLLMLSFMIIYQPQLRLSAFCIDV